VIPAKLATDNVFSQTVTEDNRTCHSQRAIILLWLLLLGVLLFSLGNWFVYLVVPSDGLQIWVRQGPFHILHVDSADTQLFQIEDQLVTIQGQPIDWWLAQQSRPWLSMIRRADQSNPTVEISLDRAGTPKTFIAPLKAGRIGSIRTQLLSHMIVSYAFLVIGAIILRFRPDERSARLTVWTMGLLALTEQVNIMPGLGAEISFASLWLFIPLRLFTRWITYAAVLHLALVFPSPRVWLARFPFLPAVIYLINPIVTLLVMLNTPGNLHDRHAVAYPWSKNIPPVNNSVMRDELAGRRVGSPKLLPALIKFDRA
jgi:hypothetical protein